MRGQARDKCRTFHLLFEFLALLLTDFCGNTTTATTRSSTRTTYNTTTKRTHT
jgi:hypothetical protein